MNRFFILAIAFTSLGAGCLSTPMFEVNAPEQTAPGQPTEAITAPGAATTTIAPAQAATTTPVIKPTTTTTKPKTTTTAPKVPLQPNQAAPSTGSVTVYVRITDTGFSPQVIAVNAGDTVVWTNKGTQNHTVASDGALLYDSGNILPGKSWSRKFAAAGGYGYHDGAHPSLKGTVTVH